MSLETQTKTPTAANPQNNLLCNPTIKIVKWKRFPETLDFTRPKRVMIVGQPGEAKSALGEALCVLWQGKIIDIYSAKDNEGLSWLRHKKYQNDVLLLHGDNCKVATEFDTMKTNDARLSDFIKHQTILTVPAFYQTVNEQWKALDRIAQIVWLRQNWSKGDVWTVNVREGTSLLYSRIGLGGDQGTAKNQLIYSIREFRHSGCSIIIDALDFMGLDVSFRRISDYIFLKAVGNEGLPNQLRWLYKYYDLFRDLMQMPKYVFIFFSRRGAVGHGVFTRPYWHKEEHENIVKELGIEIEFEGSPQEAKGLGVGDLEHVKIVELRLESGESMGAIAKKVERSGSTVQKHIDYHNGAVLNQGECDKCLRAKSSYSKMLIPVSKRVES